MGQQTKSYALWLMPEGAPRAKLAQVIRQLSRRHSTPRFAPHITLVSSIVAPGREVVKKAGVLARSLRPLRLRLTVLDWRDEYFRCLFVKVGRTSPLLRAHRMARRVFGLRARRAFLPHVSLVYGDLPVRTKRDIAVALGKRFDLKFEIRSMDLVAIEGPPSRWRRLKSISLGTS